MSKGATTMAYNEKAKDRSIKYQRENLIQVKFQLSKKSEADLIEWLNSHENKQGYLKQLMREDMERRGFAQSNEQEGEK